MKLASGALLAVLLFSLVVPAAHAQLEPAEEARRHFNEGLALADRGDWPSAVEQFELALRLRDAPSIRINLAVSLSHLGRLTEALSHIDRDLSTAPPELRAQAAELRASIEPRIGRLVVRVRDLRPDCEVRAGRRTITPGPDPVAMDPGALTVQLFCGGEAIDETEVVVPEGGAAHVVLAAPQPAQRPLDEAPRAGGGDDGLWLGVGLGLGGAALVAGGIALAVVLAQPSTTRGDFDPPTLTFGVSGSM